MPREERTHYDILGIPRTASGEQIRRAYREKMKATHPDQLAGKLAEAQASGDEAHIVAVRREIARAEALAKRTNQAHETLIDPAKRRRYDIDLTLRERIQSRPSTTTYSRTSSARSSRASTGQSRRSSARSSQSSTGQSRRSSARSNGQANSARGRPTEQPRTASRPQNWEFRPSIGTIVMALFVFAVIRTAIVNSEFNARNRDRMPPPDIVATAVFTESDDTVPKTSSNLGSVELLDAETYYQRGLDHLAQSDDLNDEAERLAVMNFLYAMGVDSEHRLAHRMLGTIHYDRWQVDPNVSDRVLARMHLSRYETLTDGSVDADVQAMLDALE